LDTNSGGQFEILTNLQKDQRLIQIENRPPLRLAPPALYHEKVKKGNDHMAESSSDGLTTVEKPSKSRQLQELKAKGSSLRLSNIRPNVFGKFVFMILLLDHRKTKCYDSVFAFLT